MDYKKFYIWEGDEYWRNALQELANSENFKDKASQLTALFCHLYDTMDRLPINLQDDLDDRMSKVWIEAGLRPYRNSLSGQYVKSNIGFLRKARHNWLRKKVRSNIRKK